MPLSPYKFTYGNTVYQYQEFERAWKRRITSAAGVYIGNTKPAGRRQPHDVEARATMNSNTPITATGPAALEQFRTDITELSTW